MDALLYLKKKVFIRNQYVVSKRQSMCVLCKWYICVFCFFFICASLRNCDLLYCMQFVSPPSHQTLCNDFNRFQTFLGFFLTMKNANSFKLPQPRREERLCKHMLVVIIKGLPYWKRLSGCWELCPPLSPFPPSSSIDLNTRWLWSLHLLPKDGVTSPLKRRE